MPSPRLMAVVTALMLVGGGQSAQAAYTLAQLQVIEALILNQDCAGLWTYLSENPEILEGDDPLAQELRNFMAGVSGGLIQCLGFVPGQGPEAAGAELGASY